MHVLKTQKQINKFGLIIIIKQKVEKCFSTWFLFESNLCGITRGCLSAGHLFSLK